MSRIRTEFTDAETRVLADFKTRPGVTDAMANASALWRSDPMLMRFLRARKLVLDDAEAMYRDVIAWRREVRADTMLEWYTEPEALRRYFPTGFHGFDVDGYPVMVERQGALYVRMCSGGAVDYDNHCVRCWVSFGCEGPCSLLCSAYKRVVCRLFRSEELVNSWWYALAVAGVCYSDMKGILDAVGEEAFLQWIIFYHERQERVVRASHVPFRCWGHARVCSCRLEKRCRQCTGIPPSHALTLASLTPCRVDCVYSNMLHVPPSSSIRLPLPDGGSITTCGCRP